MKKNEKGAVGFDLYYQEMFHERWPSLRESLIRPKNYVAVVNPFSEFSFPSHFKTLPDLNLSHAYQEDFLPPEKTKNNLSNYYLLDAASLLPFLALKIQKGDKIVDLCAAPGGKSLLCAFELQGEGLLVSNDRSALRRARIHQNFQDYLPPSVREKVVVTSHDATKWGLYEQSVYDKVLLDAPCSSERHVLENPKELQYWSARRSKALAITQFAMLASALEIVKIGGIIAYSTCALSKLENDGVLEKLHRKREGRFKLLRLEFSFGQPTKYGWQVLPDDSLWGPFYLSLIQRLN